MIISILDDLVRTDGDEGDYFDVLLDVDGVRGVASVEADGTPCAGADSLQAWLSVELHGVVEHVSDALGDWAECDEKPTLRQGDRVRAEDGDEGRVHRMTPSGIQVGWTSGVTTNTHASHELTVLPGASQ